VLNIVDRYVARSYLFSIAVCYGALTGLFLVIDISEHITTLYRYTGFWGLGPMVVRVYLPSIPVILHEATPFVVLLAAMFTVSKMERDNELLCLKSSGVSVFRVLRPVFTVAMGICLLYIANREVVIPGLQQELLQVEWLKKAKNPNQVYRFVRRDSQGNDIRIGEYRVFDRKMFKVNITTYHPAASGSERPLPKQRIYASEGHWRRDARDGQARWFLSNGTVTLYNPDGLSSGRSVRFGEEGVRVLRPGEKPAGETEFVSDLHPSQIRSHTAEREYYSTGRLREVMEDYPGLASLATSYYQRFSSPVGIFVLLMLGLPFALTGRGRSTFHSVGIGVAVCFAYMVVMVYCLRLGGDSSIPPWTAAWLPVMIFGPVGLLLLDSVPT